MSMIPEAARRYHARGWNPTPVHKQTKKPVNNNWQTTQLEPETYDAVFADKNVGIVLGPSSNNLVDVDLDNEIARMHAARILHGTEAVFGRPGSPRSHYVYQLADGEMIDRITYRDLENKMITEIRGQGAQTVFPPSIHESGEVIEWVSDGDEDGIPTPMIVTAEQLKLRVGMLASATLLSQHWAKWDGKRHDITGALAGGLFRAGYSLQVVLSFMTLVAYTSNDFDPGDRQKMVESTWERFQENPDAPMTGFTRLRELIGAPIVQRLRSWLSIKNPTLSDSTYTLTEDGNARRFVNQFENLLRFNVDTGKWHHWNGSAWIENRTQVAIDYMRQLPELIRADAAKITDEKIAAAYNKWAHSSESFAKMAATLKIVQTDPTIQITSALLDTNKYVLNVANGTLNLETGGLTNHNPTDLISGFVDITWSPSDPCPLWLAHLDLVFGGDKELIRYFQKSVGYTLTGLTREQVFFLLFGPPGTGKTTCIEVIRRLLGNMTGITDASTFMQKQKTSRANPDLAKLVGKRLVITSETEANERFASALVKRVTGNTAIVAAHLYQDEFEYDPEFKLWIDTNHKPNISSREHGIWDRIIPFPFEVVIRGTSTDRKDYQSRLFRELSGILGWAEQGAEMYLKEGLHPRPQRILNIIGQYRTDGDVLQNFLDDECEVGPAHSTNLQPFYEAFKTWLEEQGERNWRRKTFVDALREHSIAVEHDSRLNQRIVKGAKLGNEPARAQTFNMGGSVSPFKKKQA